MDRKRFSPASGLRKGGYVLAESEGEPEVILIATGSEVQIALEAYEKLQEKGIPSRLVNMPSWELFEEQLEDYRHQVLPPAVRARISIEAGSTHGWYKYVGFDGEMIGMDRFGASAPGEKVLQNFGFTSEHILRKVKILLERKDCKK
jgi:transketolase